MQVVNLRFYIILLFVSLSLLALPPAQAASTGPLVSADGLQTLLATPNPPRIIDIRTDDEYQAGHIPGAVSAPYARWRGPAESPGQLVDVDELTELVRELGIDEHTLVVVTSSGSDATDFGAAARVYWTLKYLGLEQLGLLNGGVQAWEQAGLSLDTQSPNPAASQFVPTINHDIVADQAHVAAQLDQPGTLLIDARPKNFFVGKTKAPTAKKPGTIQNAANLPHDQWFEPGTSMFVDADQAKAIAEKLITQPAEETISFCNTGHWAATDWFALSEVVGMPNVKLYPASLAEWTQATPALPMDNVPGRGEQLLDKLKSLVGKS